MIEIILIHRSLQNLTSLPFHFWLKIILHTFMVFNVDYCPQRATRHGAGVHSLSNFSTHITVLRRDCKKFDCVCIGYKAMFFLLDIFRLCFPNKETPPCASGGFFVFVITVENRSFCVLY